uniref:protein disulfide-isomerase n=1 Tax=Echeneis naucrates TaxID=173247 RepID=A0A665W7G1_ECHNA
MGIKATFNCHICYQQLISMCTCTCADLFQPHAKYESVFVCADAPWCGHCKQLEPQYAEAAGKLKAEELAIRLAKVDATEERELSDEFDVGGFPTLILFINGQRKQPITYTGKRSADGIIKWMKRRTGPGAEVLESTKSAAQFIDAHNITVVGFFDTLESEAAKVFKEVAFDVTDTEFGVTTTPEVFQKYEVKTNSVVLFKKFDDGRADFVLSEEEKLDKRNLTSFIQENSMELIIRFSKENADKIFSSKIHLHSLLFINSTVEREKAFVEKSWAVAKEFKGKMLFIVIDVMDDLPHVLKYFGVSKSDAPPYASSTWTQRRSDEDKNTSFKSNSFIQAANLSRFVVQPYYRTEEIPEDWNKGPVKVLVGKNFESVALDPTKNVFVEFYAPWCGHCKELAPIWDQLGEKYADHVDIIIAKMDATANEPIISLSCCQAVDYTGKRDLEMMSKFLDDGGVMPAEESKEDEDEEAEDEDEDKEDKEGDDSKEDDDSTGDDSKVCIVAATFAICQ